VRKGIARISTWKQTIQLRNSTFFFFSLNLVCNKFYQNKLLKNAKDSHGSRGLQFTSHSSGAQVLSRQLAFINGNILFNVISDIQRSDWMMQLFLLAWRSVTIYFESLGRRQDLGGLGFLVYLILKTVFVDDPWI